jgi:hypothetical protein
MRLKEVEVLKLKLKWRLKLKLAEAVEIEVEVEVEAEVVTKDGERGSEYAITKKRPILSHTNCI